MSPSKTSRSSEPSRRGKPSGRARTAHESAKAEVWTPNPPTPQPPTIADRRMVSSAARSTPGEARRQSAPRRKG
eukprot:scaffold62531_cov30-Tisochrysis_lutea.AAC.2